uniref:Uncharacterized protein n=1 Tax=viral metagenome TaxID=1070528 RepID=A0A6H1ZB35_9ZZZZ
MYYFIAYKQNNKFENTVINEHPLIWLDNNINIKNIECKLLFYAEINELMYKKYKDRI